MQEVYYCIECGEVLKDDIEKLDSFLTQYFSQKTIKIKFKEISPLLVCKKCNEKEMGRV